MCHNLRDGGRGPVDNTLPVAALTAGIKARYRLKNRDFCLPHLHSTPPLGGGRFPSEYCYAIWHGKTRMAWLPTLEGGRLRVGMHFKSVVYWWGTAGDCKYVQFCHFLNHICSRRLLREVSIHKQLHLSQISTLHIRLQTAKPALKNIRFVIGRAAGALLWPMRSMHWTEINSRAEGGCVIARLYRL